MTTLILVIALAFIVCMALAVPLLKDHEACRDTTLPRAGANASQTENKAVAARDTRSDRVDTFAKATEDAL